MAAHSTLIFDQHYLPAISVQDALATAARFGEAAEAKATPYTQWKVDPAPERLRVGLVSGDLRDHPVGHFLEGVLGHIDPARVELIAYPTSPLASGLTERIKTKFAAWKPIHRLDDESAARLIHDDAIHCLIDLAGHSGHNRLPLFAWKPAPLQVAWLGYFGTTGLRAIDYVLGDPVVATSRSTRSRTRVAPHRSRRSGWACRC